MKGKMETWGLIWVQLEDVPAWPDIASTYVKIADSLC